MSFKYYEVTVRGGTVVSVEDYVNVQAESKEEAIELAIAKLAASLHVRSVWEVQEEDFEW